MRNVHLYFLKLFGCKVEEAKANGHQVPIDIAQFSSAIMTGRPHPEVYLRFGKCDGTIGRSNLHCWTTENGAVVAGWLYELDKIAVSVQFAHGGKFDDPCMSMALGTARPAIENRPGAGGNIAAEAVVRASPDSYMLLMALLNNAVNTTLYDKLNFNFVRDIAPVASIGSGPYVMLVNPSFPAKTVPEFIAYAQANPGKVSFASAGIGSGPHLAGELFKMMAGVDMVHVPYRGGAPAITDLLGGQVQVYFPTATGSIEYIRTGKLRALAVTTARRSEVLPDIPTVADFLPGYQADGWQGIGAPKNTPAEIVEKLNKEINTLLADPKKKARLAELGSVAMPMTRADFGKLIVDETEKCAKVIRAANIKPE